MRQDGAGLSGAKAFLVSRIKSIKIIENVPKEAQTTAKNYQTYEIEDNTHMDDDQDNENFLENDGDILASYNRKLKMYGALQSALQNLNVEQKMLFEDALNKYIMGNITENDVIDLLPNILLIDENSRELAKQHEINKYKSKSCSYNRNNSNFIGIDDPECRPSTYNDIGAIDLKRNMLGEGCTQNSGYTDNYDNSSTFKSKIDETTHIPLNTVPWIIDLIRSFKNKKISTTTQTSTDTSSTATAPTNILNYTTTEIIRQYENKDKSNVIDVLTLLSLLANLTDEQRAQTMLRSNNTKPPGTAPLCPYTISFGTSPRYKSPYEYYNRNLSGNLVTMCYVCGLEEYRIPESSLCEDAFDDVDWSLKKYSYQFIKYCRYDDNNYCVHTRDKRSIWGRWTGGCSMRRIDISGVYTQRTCRNREWPTRGHHFASHRMARLEFVLDGITDGCAISPTASLVPLSRSISLFARFIACVCQGSLCNAGISYITFSYLKLFAMSLAAFILIYVT